MFMLLVTYAGKKWQDPCRMPLIMSVHKTKAKLKRNRMQYTPCLRKSQNCFCHNFVTFY